MSHPAAAHVSDDDDDLFDSNDVPMTENPVHTQPDRSLSYNGYNGAQPQSNVGMGPATPVLQPYQPYSPYVGGPGGAGAGPGGRGPGSTFDDDMFNDKQGSSSSMYQSRSPTVAKPKGVAFKEAEQYMYASPQKSPSDFFAMGGKQYEMERVDTYDLENGPLNGVGGGVHPPHFTPGHTPGHSFSRPYSNHMTFSGDDYMINQMEDADADGELDPFGDDDSLFSETGEEMKRANTMRRGTTLRGRSGSRKDKNGNDIDQDLLDEEDDDQILNYGNDDDFRPRLNYTKTIKKVMLVNGNYVIDAPVPKALLETYGKKITEGGREMSYMRYTAATCGPSNFLRYNYSLRQPLYSPPRETELMICVTMYNENEILLARTLKGIFENITDLTRRADPVWGEDSWKKVVITIVVDGRVNLHKRAEKLMVALGVYQDGYAKSKINEKNVKAHIYEYTSTVGIEAVNDRVHLVANSTPVQFIFCMKEKNAKKINSHRWCLQSFGPILNPKVVMLLDCGTQPAKDAFYYLWRTFRDDNVAGACGEMRAALGPGRKLLGNPLVAAQNFEYKISNILDKPMESVFGFISVLPGAFSAYRYDALLNVDGQGPLEKYFKGEFLHQDANVGDEFDDERKLKEKNYQEAGIFTSNMYLAEDRILCFELVAKKGHNYILRYVKEAKAETDVPERIDEFVLQRRRWLNGSFFAAGYALFHWTKIWKSNHSLLRKLFLQLEFYYQLITLLVSWFSLSCFFLVFRILTQNLGSSDMNFQVGAYLAVILLWFYVGSVVCTFVLAFGNTPRGTRKFYMVIASFFAVLMAYLMFSAIYLAVHTVQSIIKDHPNNFSVLLVFTDSKFRDLIVSVLSTYTLYFIGAFMYGEPSFMLTSFVQYVLLSPTYINVLNIYAFANIHDVSWGTKELPKERDLGSAKSTGNKDELVMVAPGASDEVDDVYYNILDDLRAIPPPETAVITKKQKDDAYYAFIRTITVLIWMLTNAILIAIVLNAAGLDTFTGKNVQATMNKNAQIFLTIILWIVAGLALFRFFGSTLYMIFKSFRPIKWKFRSRREVKRNSRTQ
ncbi:chitin synthase 2 [[Candida] anglica]|uniref:chitin synthase n=1 Tax=[Candida] anglica TaxID=148631 RepID=A0ABP0EF95_9ASCO